MCEISDKVSCALASASAYSEFFGLIPMAILGVVVNGLIVVLLTSHKWPLLFSPDTRKKLPGIIKLTVLGVFATSLAMGYISFFVIDIICPFCLGTYALSLITLASTWMYLGGGLDISGTSIIGATGVVVATLGIGAAFNASQKIQFGGKNADKIIAATIMDWKNQPSKEIATVSPLVYNKVDQPVMRMVEFADYLCPHCKIAAPVLKLFVKSRPDVTLEFQAFPIDGTCNESLNKSDGARCMLARFTYCAQKQDSTKGWDAQKWIFDNQRELLGISQATQKVKAQISELGLDQAQMDQCIESEEAHQVIKDQAALGRELRITGTPSLFVNGRKVQGIHLPVLQQLYEEIKKAK